MNEFLETVIRTYTGKAYFLTVFSGVLTITGERFLYRRRGYKREAAITAGIGWFYVIGGTVLYGTLSLLR